MGAALWAKVHSCPGLSPTHHFSNTPSAIISQNHIASDCLLTWARVLFTSIICHPCCPLAILWVPDALLLHNISKVYQPKHWDIMLCPWLLVDLNFVRHSKCRHHLAGLGTPIVNSRLHVTSRTQCQENIKQRGISRPEQCMHPNDALLRTLKAQILRELNQATCQWWQPQIPLRNHKSKISIRQTKQMSKLSW